MDHLQGKPELDRLTTYERDCGDCQACCTLMAVPELNKPMRQACPHQCRNRCAIYPQRPQPCRDYHCEWLRGNLGQSNADRPSELGVLFDLWIDPSDGSSQLSVMELWPGALSQSRVAELIAQCTRHNRIVLIQRDGSWSAKGTSTVQNTAM